MKESDLYQPVKFLMNKLGYECYAEVEAKVPGNWNSRADIVCMHSAGHTCIVEMKTSLSMDLLDQAYKWLVHTESVYIAIPTRKKGISSFVRKVLGDLGIGIIEVNPYGVATVSLAPKTRVPNTRVKWSEILLPEHQTWVEGGSQAGGYVTEYSLTIDRVKKLMLTEPEKWWTVAEIITKVNTHYVNPQPALTKALVEYEDDWCMFKKVKHRLYFKVKVVK